MEESDSPIDTERLIKALPKVEQHVHIVGSTRPETLLWLAEEGDVETPFKTVEDVRRFFHYRDFPHFISIYSTIVECITEEAQFERITYELLESDARCNVCYVEASFSALDHVYRGLDYSRMIDAINRGIQRARQNFGVECDVRIDLVRNYGPEAAMEVLDLIEEKGSNVVSIDIGGSEERFSPKPFASVYRRGSEMGLHLVAHAGEAAGSESIWEAIEYLSVEHIGHGIAAAGDVKLMECLRKRGITIEACPVSNVRTGVVQSLERHPIRNFIDHGLSVTVSSDDPSMFDTDMNNEYLQLSRKLGFSASELFSLSLNGVRSSFLSEKRKLEMLESFKKEYQQLSDINGR